MSCSCPKNAHRDNCNRVLPDGYWCGFHPAGLYPRTLEINIAGLPETDEPVLRVNCGTNQRIEIDKLYGPLCSEDVRVRLEYKGEVADWVVERHRVDHDGIGDGWEEKARWFCQESYPEDDDE